MYAKEKMESLYNTLNGLYQNSDKQEKLQIMGVFLAIIMDELAETLWEIDHEKSDKT